MKFDKLFFTKRFGIPFYKAKWGIVEIHKENCEYFKPCIIAGKGLCLDIAAESFLNECDISNIGSVKIHPAKKRVKNDGSGKILLLSNDETINLTIEENFFENLYQHKFYEKRLENAFILP
ncbi:MAG: hypothetical protein LBR66_06000 [Candidatus Symbiothrix sp.]|jgi:hypothetical protein|nr:hypothetical protein [Candidatus Symbiothrix sp.]